MVCQRSLRRAKQRGRGRGRGGALCGAAGGLGLGQALDHEGLQAGGHELVLLAGLAGDEVAGAHEAELGVERLVRRLSLMQRGDLAVVAVLLGEEGAQRRDVEGRRDEQQGERGETQGAQLDG